MFLCQTKKERFTDLICSLVNAGNTDGLYCEANDDERIGNGTAQRETAKGNNTELSFILCIFKF